MMELKEFRNRIKRVRKKIVELRRNYGVCCSLNSEFGFYSINTVAMSDEFRLLGCVRNFNDSSTLEISLLFDALMRPMEKNGKSKMGIDSRSNYWLGCGTEKNVNLRLWFLDMFEAILIEEDLVKEISLW